MQLYRLYKHELDSTSGIFMEAILINGGVTWSYKYVNGGCRKLAELGFKRSAEQCKQKFEEQTRSFNSNSSGNSIDINVNYSKTSNYRLLVNELEELYDHHLHHNPIPPPPAPPQQQQPHEVPHDDNNDSGDGIVEKSMEEEDEEEEVGRGGEEGERMAGQDNIEEVDSRAMETTRLAKDWKRLVEEEGDDKVVKKRKRQEKFEMFKRFCENVVEKLMAQQEEMHNKLLEDMIRRDREMVEKEEAWKKMEIDRVNKELDHRAQEQSIAHSRQAAIIELLKRFTSPPRECRDDGDNTSPDPNLASRVDTESKSGMASANAGPVDDDWPNPPPPPAIISSSPGSSKTSQNPSASSNNEGSDKGKRWPREEVLALIKLRSSIQGNSEDRDQQQQPQGSIRAPLWERISRGMSELGYKRSAKRCKEKWENINKYFRKTKDSNASKKRSLDSRTCPYFHQLSALYNQGKLAPDVAVPPENHPSSPENRPS